jgi:hypothetical protein
MARWNPPANVGPNEQIGRRLFDEPMLMGASQQPSYSGILFTHFEEKQGDETSLDRMGASSIDHQVCKYLIPRAEAHGQKFVKPKPFNGWAVVQAKELIQSRKPPKLPLHSSPVKDPEPNDNIYHSHVVKPQDLNGYLMALHLRHIFTTYGKIKKNDSSMKSWRDHFWAHPVLTWMLSKLRNLKWFSKSMDRSPN